MKMWLRVRLRLVVNRTDEVEIRVLEGGWWRSEGSRRFPYNQVSLCYIYRVIRCVIWIV